MAEIGVGQEPLAWRARFFFVDFLHPGPHPLFAEELEGWAVEIVPQTPEALKFVEWLDQLWMVQAGVADELAHVGEVALFDVGVVVLARGAGTSEHDGLLALAKVAVKRMREPFAAIVGIEPADGERQLLLGLAHALMNEMVGAGPRGAQIRPVTMNTSHDDTPEMGATHITSAVGRRVRLQPARLVHLPRPSAQGNLGANIVGWRGSTILLADFEWLEQAIHMAGGKGQEFGF